ncbi:MAG: hypothetical protein AUH06_05545 [Gemmatimonadetes bacterium 13_2_20CM_69_27]|nr:MAG: hypothetical protein AUH06_05545 [Gemmatimonadetes bacterium 13_2_20CM_69_27]PYO31348.1 MAG: hypothetical protein DMD32_09355 [Gemmatimonadota bacterium]PYP26478.1 MAG: hypothetical protein DMD51_05405 [Gemmatimonadota bacterium]
MGQTTTNLVPRRDDPPVDDRALVEQLRGGDQTALAGLYHRHAGRLLGIAFRLTGSRSEAEDVVQDVFVGLPLAVRRYHEQGEFVGWLRTVTVRVALGHLRREGRRRQVPLNPLSEPSGGAGPEALGERLELERAITTLPDALRTVFVLKEVAGYSHAEIGRMLGIRTGTSEVRLCRAIRTLRRVLGRVQ